MLRLIWVSRLAALGPMVDEGKKIVITALPVYHIFVLTVNCFGFLDGGAGPPRITCHSP